MGRAAWSWLVAGSLGFALGATTGYLRGIFDDVVMRLIDIMLAFPPLILAMAIASFLGPDLTNTMLAIAIVHIPKYTRLARSEALSLREALFVQAARVGGASEHADRVPPHHPELALVDAGGGDARFRAGDPDGGVARVPGARGAAADARMGPDGGRRPQVPARLAVVLDVPGLTIMLVVIAANVVGDGLRDLLDPRLRS